jgi:hypothetical protein
VSAPAKAGAKAPKADQRVVRAAMAALRETVTLTRAEQAKFRRELTRRLRGAP